MMETLNNCSDCLFCNEKIPFFNLLSDKELELINDDRYSVKFKSDELILKQGITATHLISLIDGIAKIYIEGVNNKNLLYQLIGGWQLVEDPGLHTDDKKYHFSVAALTDVKVCFINAKNFLKVLEKNSSFANAVIKHRSQNTVYFFNRVISLTQKQMVGRMADGLLYLSNDFYRSADFNMNLSRQDLADLTAMSKDSAIRILKEFERDKIISLKGRKIKIFKQDLLKKLSVHG